MKYAQHLFSGLALFLLADSSGGNVESIPLKQGKLFDGRPDIVFTRVNDSVLPLVNQRSSDSNFLSLSFHAPASIVTGARVEVSYEDGLISTAEVYAGGGYLSQSEQKLFFGYKKENPPSSLKIRWSDGSIDEGPWSGRSRIVVKPGDGFVGGSK